MSPNSLLEPFRLSLLRQNWTRGNWKMNEKVEEGMMAVALYDFVGVREDNLPFQEGEIITILEMNESGWWKGTNINGDVGIFPYNYVKSVENIKTENFRIVRAIAEYESEIEGELSYKVDTCITLIRPMDKEYGWGRIYSLPKNNKRIEKRIVGKFKYSHVDETTMVDKYAEEEEIYLAELEAERLRQLAIQAQSEKNQIIEEKNVMQRIVDKKTTKPDLERETLRRENEKLQAELEKMKKLLADKELKANKIEQKVEAAVAEKSRLQLEEERKKDKEAHFARAQLINAKAEKSFAKNITEEGFSAPKPRRDRRDFKLSKFSGLGKSGNKCKTCGRSVTVGPFGLRAIGSLWHRDCFKCGTCSKILRGEWLEHKGYPYCSNCHKAGFGIKGFGYGGALAGNYKKT